MTSRAVSRSRTDGRVAARAAATASVGAAVIHFAVTPAHWSDWLPSGVFFASIAVFQLIWALLAWTRPPAVLLAAGIVANAGFAALWVWSRTAGEPFGPNAGEPEPVQAAGICALLLECYIVMGAAWAWYRGDRAEPVSGVGSALILLGANTVVAAAVTAGVASGLHGHDHHHQAPHEAQGEYQAPHSEHAAGHHNNQSEPAVPLDAQVTRPPTAPGPAETGLPLTEPSHDVDGDQHHAE
ncbi:MAG TPA: hypothetical protein VGA66_04935 [Mycobacterium sp.]